MAIIGTFTRTSDGKLTGSLKTLTVSSKLQFVSEANKSHDNAADYRNYLASFELGAAWRRTAKESGRTYWSVKLDDPAFSHRSMPAWSRRRTATASTCCGHAAAAIDRPAKAPRPHRRGAQAIIATGSPAADSFTP